MYTVKEVAEQFDLTEKTIRYYTDKSLVPNLQRDKNNNRVFDDESLKWLLCVKHLRKCGMLVEDIKTYIDLCLEGDASIKERYDIFKKQRDIALQQLEEAKDRAYYMEEKTNYYLDVLNGVIPNTLHPDVQKSI